MKKTLCTIIILAMIGCAGCATFKMDSGSFKIEDKESGLSVGSEVTGIEATGDIKTNKSRSEVKDNGKTDGTILSGP